MLNPFEGMFFEKGTKRQGMDDLFGGGGFFTGSSAGYLGSSVGSYDGEKDGFLGGYNNNSGSHTTTTNGNGSVSNGYSKDREKATRFPVPASNRDRNSSDLRSSPVGRDQPNDSSPFKRDSGPSQSYRSPNFTGELNPAGPIPPLDFGDRYSANRNRDRRNDYNKHGPQQQDQMQRSSQSQHNRNSGERFERRNDYERTGDHDQKNDYGHKNEYDMRNDFSHSLSRASGQLQQQHSRDFPTPSDAASKELPPRFKKISFNQPPPIGTGSPFIGGAPNLSVPPPTHAMMGSKDVEVSLRPQQSTANMLFKPKTPSMLPKSAISRTTDGSSPLGENSLLGPPMPTHHKIMQQKEAAFLIKQGSLDAKGRKEKKAAANKGPTREEVFTKVDAILTNYLASQSLGEAVESWKENEWLPSKMTQTGVSHLFKLILDKNDEERQLSCNFLEELLKDGAVAKVHCFEAINKIVSTGGLESSKSRMSLADVAAWAVVEKIFNLGELADLFHGGQWHPVFLEILKQLQKKASKDELVEMYNSASIRLIDQLPESDRSDEKLVQIMESYELTFLMPLLSIRQDMAKQLVADPNPATFSKWIADSIEPEYLSQPGFILALFDIVFRHIVTSSTLPAGADPTANPDKNLVEAEKDLLSKFRSVLQPYVHDKPTLQLVGVYALQVFCNEKNFPKGMLLRAFVNCYEMDILDEHAFLQWKEDVNDTYPGKGKALFQVKMQFICLWLLNVKSSKTSLVLKELSDFQ